MGTAILLFILWGVVLTLAFLSLRIVAKNVKNKAWRYVLYLIIVGAGALMILLILLYGLLIYAGWA